MIKDNLYRKGSFLQKLYSIKEIPSLVDENNNPTDYAGISPFLHKWHIFLQGSNPMDR